MILFQYYFSIAVFIHIYFKHLFSKNRYDIGKTKTDNNFLNILEGVLVSLLLHRGLGIG